MESLEYLQSSIVSRVSTVSTVSTVLYYTPQSSIIRYSIYSIYSIYTPLLYAIVLRYTVFCYTLQYLATVQYYGSLHYPTVYYSILQYTIVPYTTLHYPTLPYRTYRTYRTVWSASTLLYSTPSLSLHLVRENRNTTHHTTPHNSSDHHPVRPLIPQPSPLFPNPTSHTNTAYYPTTTTTASTRT